MTRQTMARARIGVFLLGGLLALLLAGVTSAKQGMVITKDKKTFIGDVDENTTPGQVNIDSPTMGKITLYAQNVEKVVYFNTPADELKARLSVMNKKDVAARVELARFAFDNKMFTQARELLVEALQIEPANRKAADLLKEVDDQIKASHPVETQPATAPAAAPPARPGLLRARRTLTPDEVNYVRQNEWQDERDPNVHVKLIGDAINGAKALGLVDPNEVTRMTPAQIGWRIVQKGPPGLKKLVRLGGDPGPLAVYRATVQRYVIANCATGACHNTEKGGNFYLFTEPMQGDATIVSDYIILNEFTKTVNGVEFSMIDRLHPEDSLLVQFALPQDLAKVPHPKGAGYLPPAKAPLTIKQVQAWIQSLSPVAPAYDIDLAAPAPKPDVKAPTTRPAAASGRTGTG